MPKEAKKVNNSRWDIGCTWRNRGHGWITSLTASFEGKVGHFLIGHRRAGIALMNSFSGTQRRVLSFFVSTLPSLSFSLSLSPSPVDVRLLISIREHLYCRILPCDGPTKQERKRVEKKRNSRKDEREKKGGREWKKREKRKEGKGEGKNDYAGSKPRLRKLQFDTVMPEIRGTGISRER